MNQNRFTLNRYPLGQAIVLCLTCFGLFFAFYKPVISAFEDLQVEYLLGGGFGLAPDLHLFYLNGWHPLLFSPVYLLYRWIPEANWYGIFLLLIQFLSHVALLYQLLKKLGPGYGSLVYLIFFLLFGASFLQKLEISTTSSLLALSACIGLITKFQSQKQEENRTAILCGIILVIALLLRLHTAVLILILCLFTAILVLKGKFLKRFLLVVVIALAASLGAFQLQKIYYQQEKDYSSLEKKSALYFNYINRKNFQFTPVDSFQKIASSFISTSYWIDSSLVIKENIDPMIKSYSLSALSDLSENKAGLYWAFRNNRIYLLLIALLIALSITTGKRRLIYNSVLAILTGLLAYFTILVFFKMREHIILSVAATVFFSVLLIISKERTRLTSTKRIIFLSLLFCLGGWKLAQLKRSQSVLNQQIAFTKSFISSVAASPKTLFLNFGNEGWQALGVFDSPKNFPIKNVITRELFMTGKCFPIFTSFGIGDLKNQLSDNERVVLMGSSQPDWKGYFRWKQKREVEMIASENLLNIPCFQLKSIH